jgi:FtsP/CotA-like multicopper oxidase with cupredoxin domain
MNRTTRWIAVVLWLVGGACLIQAYQALVAPPPGASLLLELSGEGVQIYTCEEKNHHLEWVFKAPEAKLYDTPGHAVGTHSAGPTWRADNGAAVVGEVITTANAPEATAIPWLLLRVKNHEGTGILLASLSAMCSPGSRVFSLTMYRFTMNRLSTRGVRVILRSLTPVIHPVVAHDSDPATPHELWQFNGVLEILCWHSVSPVD